MNQIKDFIFRNATWLILGFIAIILLKPALAEINTFLLITVIECTAIALSGLAVFAFTKIDFTQEIARNNLGYIFLGVHLCVGFAVIGVYIAQI
jgi:hypothetical protein